jgi:hypothetical protein
LANTRSIIDDPFLSKSKDRVRLGDSVTLSLTFKIKGSIRESFTPKNWERAYNKHDNILRMTIWVTLKSGRNTIVALKFVRKAVLFWTRNPKIPYRIWASVIKDDMPFHTLSIEEIQSMLFDVNKIIELKGDEIKLGNRKLIAEIKVSWGTHQYTQSTIISNKSNSVEIEFTE